MSEILSSINWVDIFILILLLRIGYVSSNIGVGKQLIPFLVTFFAFIISLRVYDDAARFLYDRFSFPVEFSRFFVYLVILVIYFVICRVMWNILSIFSRSDGASVSGVEKAGGAFIGIARALGIICMAVILFALTPVKFVESSVAGSFSGTFVLETASKIYSKASNFIFRSAPVSPKSVFEKITKKKKKYFFNTFNAKEHSKFYKSKI